MNYNTHMCPICGKHQFPSDCNYEVCPYCGWQNDSVMNDDPSYWGGANALCQLDHRLRYFYYLSKNPKYHYARDGYPDVLQIEEMKCPVCSQMRFMPLRWDEIYCGVVPSDVHCQYCGWNYDLKQMESPDLKNGANEMSLNEYRDWYANKIAEDPEYVYFNEQTDKYVPTPHKCPVCAKYQFSDKASFEVCSFCGWEDDIVQLSNPDFVGGANKLSLRQYRKEYKKIIKEDPSYRWDKHK